MAFKQIKFEEKDLKKLFKVNSLWSRFWKQTKKMLRGVTMFALLFGIFFLALNSSAFYQRAGFITNGTDHTIEKIKPLVVDVPVKPDYAPEIQISKINLRAPVNYGVTYDSIIESLRSGVVHYQGSAVPGQVGNTVLLGHSSDFPWSAGQYKTIFSLLDQLALGDEITLPYGKEIYTYRINEIKKVKPNDLAVLERTTDARVTLITCYPVGTTISRLIVIGQLVGAPLNGTQESSPFLGSEIVSAR